MCLDKIQVYEYFKKITYEEFRLSVDVNQSTLFIEYLSKLLAVGSLYVILILL